MRQTVCACGQEMTRHGQEMSTAVDADPPNVFRNDLTLLDDGEEAAQGKMGLIQYWSESSPMHSFMERQRESLADHILVIDDDAALCKLVARFLVREGFQT